MVKFMTLVQWFRDFLRGKELVALRKEMKSSQKEMINNMTVNLQQVEKDSELLKTASEELSQAAVSLTNTIEKRLKIMEKRFDTVRENVNDIVVIKTSERRIININNFACKVFKLNAEDCIGKTLEELIDVNPNLAEICSLFDASEVESIRENKQVKFETVFHDALLDIIVTPMSYDSENGKELIIIGHLKEIEKVPLSDIILNTIPNPIVVLDSDCKIFYLNHSAEEKLNNTLGILQGKPLEMIVDEKLKGKILKQIKKNPSKEVKIEKRITLTCLTRKDGTKLYMLVGGL